LRWDGQAATAVLAPDGRLSAWLYGVQPPPQVVDAAIAGAEAGRLGGLGHEFFERRGDDLYTKIPITVSEATLGAKIEVPTVQGKAQLRIAPGTQSGQKFRLRRRGAPSLRDPNAHGDQFVEVQVVLPKVISEETKELLRKYAQMNPENPRVAMGLE